ncbi:hypothetical protein EDB19DRAFT_2026409 [Suillus lakei]|nr:hypothetical protein EDB19DRAFT_2026409 [Suillus lakei]
MSHPSMTESMKDNVIQDIYETRQTICVGVVGFTILVWDHLVTSADEVRHQMHQNSVGLKFINILRLNSSGNALRGPNRYLTPLVFIVNLVAYNLPSLDYTGPPQALGIEIVGINDADTVEFIRPPRKHLLMMENTASLHLTAWLLSHAGRMVSLLPRNVLVYDKVPTAVSHSDHVHSCTMVFNSGSIASASAWLPLLYDTYIFGLTLNCALPSIRKREAGRVLRTLFADGLLYYSVICAINLVLTIMIVRAHPGVKNIAAQLELLLTVTMMSRITLNVRKQASYGPSPRHSQVESIIMSTRNGVISTPSGGVVMLGRLRSHSVSSAARVESSNRARSGSASSIVSPVRTTTVAENPSISATRPRLSTIFSATNTPTTLSPYK